ncbi:Protein of unknown function, partial [Gryllus bimaculatus]
GSPLPSAKDVRFTKSETRRLYDDPSALTTGGSTWPSEAESHDCIALPVVDGEGSTTPFNSDYSSDLYEMLGDLESPEESAYASGNGSEGVAYSTDDTLVEGERVNIGVAIVTTNVEEPKAVVCDGSVWCATDQSSLSTKDAPATHSRDILDELCDSLSEERNYDFGKLSAKGDASDFRDSFRNSVKKFMTYGAGGKKNHLSAGEMTDESLSYDLDPAVKARSDYGLLFAPPSDLCVAALLHISRKDARLPPAPGFIDRLSEETVSETETRPDVKPSRTNATSSFCTARTASSHLVDIETTYTSIDEFGSTPSSSLSDVSMSRHPVVRNVSPPTVIHEENVANHPYCGLCMMCKNIIQETSSACRSVPVLPNQSGMSSKERPRPSEQSPSRQACQPAVATRRTCEAFRARVPRPRAPLELTSPLASPQQSLALALALSPGPAPRTPAASPVASQCRARARRCRAGR